MQPWTKTAFQYWQQAELPGKANNPLIIDFFQYVEHVEPINDETPCCAAAMNFWLEVNGIKGTNSPIARSFLKWGIKLDEPKLECIVIHKSPLNLWAGHVGILCYHNVNHHILYGANQDNMCGFKTYPNNLIIGLRWPSPGSYQHYFNNCPPANIIREPNSLPVPPITG